MEWLQAKNYKQMPWKNGMGITREIAVSQAQKAVFGWRISIATVSQSCPFSQFNGVDRTIAFLSGDGFFLDVDSKQTVVLDQFSQPFSFKGEAVVYAQLQGKESIDLNIMTDREDYSHVMTRVHANKQNSLTKESDFEFIVFNSDCKVTFNNEIFNIEKFDTLELSEENQIEIVTEQNDLIFYKIKIHKNK